MGTESTLELFTPSEGETGDPLDVIERDLAAWERVVRTARDPRVRTRLIVLARDLRGLRDCYRASRHPRIREALLREASDVTRRMRAVARRMHLDGVEEFRAA